MHQIGTGDTNNSSCWPVSDPIVRPAIASRKQQMKSTYFFLPIFSLLMEDWSSRPPHNSPLSGRPAPQLTWFERGSEAGQGNAMRKERRRPILTLLHSKGLLVCKGIPKCGSQNSSISFTWEIVRNANSQSPSETYYIRASEGRAQQAVF